MSEQKWITGTTPKKGDYILLKIPFEPETITVEYDGNKKSHVSLHTRCKGAGRFKSGTPIGLTDKGEPITLLVDCRIGNLPKATQSTASVKQAELM